MAAVRIVVYRFTGKQAFFRIPESWCHECDLTVQAVERAVQRAEVAVECTVRPWWVHVVPALLKGGWHPPVVVVNGRRVVQGRVPSDQELDAAIDAAAAAEKGAPSRTPARESHSSER